MFVMFHSFVFCIFFGIMIIYNKRQSSLGEVIPGGNPTGMSYLYIKTSPGSCVGKPKAVGSLMHLTASGLPALGFPTQLPGKVLMSIIA